MPEASVNGTRLHYQRAGAGVPPLVFVHGFACAHEDWRHQAAAFAGRHCVVACDLRGHGASPGDAASSDIETFGADVAALLGALDLSGAVLVGHSMGTRVVLVLVDGSFQGAAGARAEEAARATVSAAGYGAFVGPLFEQMFLVASPEADRIRERALALAEAVGAALWPSMAGWDARRMTAALENITV